MNKNTNFIKNIFKYYFKKKILIFNINILKLIIIEGDEYINFLQNIIISDINIIFKNKILITCKCNFNGKVQSIIIIFIHENKLFLLIRNDIFKYNVNEILKYDIYNKINLIINHDYNFIGICGNKSYIILKKIFGFFKISYNSIVYINSFSIINLSKNLKYRFLLISNKILIKKIIKILIDNYKYKFINDNLWLYLDIIDKYPIINKYNCDKLFPQDIGIDNLNIISYKKGCYLGQEIISKINFLKLNKNSLYIINVYINKYKKLLFLFNNKKICKILFYIKFNNKIIIQATINNIFFNKNKLFLKNNLCLNIKKIF